MKGRLHGKSGLSSPRRNASGLTIPHRIKIFVELATKRFFTYRSTVKSLFWVSKFPYSRTSKERFFGVPGSEHMIAHSWLRCGHNFRIARLNLCTFSCEILSARLLAGGQRITYHQPLLGLTPPCLSSFATPVAAHRALPPGIFRRARARSRPGDQRNPAAF